jgi:hypothetical protein
MAATAISSLASETLMAEYDSTISCLESKDSAFSSAEEIVRYKELKARITEVGGGGSGPLDLSNLGVPSELSSSLNEFATKKSEITGKLDSAKSLLGKFV